MERLKIGICGWGNVATGLFNTVNKNKELIKDSHDGRRRILYFPTTFQNTQ